MNVEMTGEPGGRNLRERPEPESQSQRARKPTKPTMQCLVSPDPDGVAQPLNPSAAIKSPTSVKPIPELLLQSKRSAVELSCRTKIFEGAIDAVAKAGLGWLSNTTQPKPHKVSMHVV